ncbi:TetR-like C-terminal domain-containing protein [Cellulomonas sp. Leaf334]|uniref:TetR-like C-terminal domain-containing protein n=1 Tax=Cellulomonas sp. Leaf334 TaxID=1736339 RepID=UPI0006FB673F|nr:TetR-like C-terminal domain-containing protein [Cellulomonas sp. Leaf334]KQR12243.1 TetR family transcriptional regulator [Cellulomonas sp. Leaf334]
MPRAGLDRAAVVALALAVVDDGGSTGFADLTLAAVAARAGVAVPSLYKHVAGLPALRREVALVCIEQYGMALRAVRAEHSGAELLPAMARSIRHLARRSPGRYGAVQGAAWVHDPDAQAVRDASVRVVDELGDAVTALGVPPERRIDAVRAVRAAVHGFVVLELDGGFGMPDDVDVSFDFLVAGLVGGLERLSVS